MNSLYCSIALHISVWMFNEACNWVTIVLFCHVSRVSAHLSRKHHVDYTASRHIVLFYFRSVRHHCKDKFDTVTAEVVLNTYERHTRLDTHVGQACARLHQCYRQHCQQRKWHHTQVATGEDKRILQYILHHRDNGVSFNVTYVWSSSISMASIQSGTCDEGDIGVTNKTSILQQQLCHFSQLSAWYSAVVR